MPNKIQEQADIEILLKKPKMFSVIMHNDDYTTMDFVVDILIRIFGKSQTDAARIMMEVHETGKSIAGVYTYDIAVTKKMQAMGLAAQKGFPLKITVSEVDE